VVAERDDDADGHDAVDEHDLAARVAALEHDRDDLRLEWADAIGKLAKLAAKLSVAHRRELDRATGEGDQLALTPPTPPAPVDRATRRAQLRASIARNGGAALLLIAQQWLLSRWLGDGAQLALFPAILGGLKLLAGTGIGKKVVSWGAGKLLGSGVAGKLLGSGAGRAVQAGVMAATEAGAGKAARRIFKAGVAAVGAGAAFEAGTAVVKRATGAGAPAVTGAVFEPGTGVMAPGGRTMVEIAPGVESDGRGGMWVRTVSGRRRRISGFDALGNPVFRKPRMNVLNPRALGRANRRVTGFATVAQRMLKHLAAQSRKFAPPRQARRGRANHKAGCKCFACKAA